MKTWEFKPVIGAERVAEELGKLSETQISQAKIVAVGINAFLIFCPIQSSDEIHKYAHYAGVAIAFEKWLESWKNQPGIPSSQEQTLEEILKKFREAFRNHITTAEA